MMQNDEINKAKIDSNWQREQIKIINHFLMMLNILDEFIAERANEQVKDIGLNETLNLIYQQTQVENAASEMNNFLFALKQSFEDPENNKFVQFLTKRMNHSMPQLEAPDSFLFRKKKYFTLFEMSDLFEKVLRETLLEESPKEKDIELILYKLANSFVLTQNKELAEDDNTHD